MLFVLSFEIRAAKQDKREERLSGSLGAKPPPLLWLLPNSWQSGNNRDMCTKDKICWSSNYCRADNESILLHYEIINRRRSMHKGFSIFLLTWRLAGPLVRFKSVAILAVTAERTFLIKAVLAAQAWGITLINIFTGFSVIAELITHRACALGPKWPLDTAMCAASIVIRAAFLIWVESRKKESFSTENLK